MSAVPDRKMDVDEYLAWAEGRPGRYELYAGTVYAMAPERARHAEVKLATQIALQGAIRRAGIPCHVLPDGMTIRIDRNTAHEPDALVYCGPKLPRDAIEVPNAMIVVEVLSPSARHIDAAVKLASYFRLPSVLHYLMIDPEQPVVIHHARSAEGSIATRINDGILRFDPPGMEFLWWSFIRAISVAT